MKVKKFLIGRGIWLLILSLALIAVLTIPALAQSYTQRVSPSYTLLNEEGSTIAEVWHIGEDWFVSGDVSHYCNCEVNNGNCDRDISTPTGTEYVPSTPTDQSLPTPTPTFTTPPDPTSTPPTKPKCNRGIGNGSEGCDPGNSSGQGNGGGRRAGEDREE